LEEDFCSACLIVAAAAAAEDGDGGGGLPRLWARYRSYDDGSAETPSDAGAVGGAAERRSRLSSDRAVLDVDAAAAAARR
jgi:hypothetical protein